MRLFRWPRTGCKISVSDGVVGHAVCRGWGSAHTDVCTHTWRGRWTRPIFDHREAEVRLCLWPRTGWESVGEGWRTGAGGLPFRDSVRTRTSTCTRCMHSRMQLSSLHFHEVCDSPRFFFSKDGFHGQFGRLTRECRARATCRVHTRTRSGTSTSCNESRPLALRDEETAAAVTRDTAQQTKAGAI